MASITGLTAERMAELLAGWEGVQSGYQDLYNQIDGVQIGLGEHDAALTDLRDNQMPALQATLNENDLALADLNDNVLPNLAQTVADNQEMIDDLNNLTLPAMQEAVDNAVTNANELPQVLTGTDAPEMANNRELEVGDTWIDDAGVRRMWDGVTWADYTMDIPDLSLTVKKFKTGTHLIY